MIRHSELREEKQQLISLIKYSHLVVLNVASAHPDYTQPFLVKKYCQLPNLFNLTIGYESLARFATICSPIESSTQVRYTLRKLDISTLA